MLLDGWEGPGLKPATPAPLIGEVDAGGQLGIALERSPHRRGVIALPGAVQQYDLLGPAGCAGLCDFLRGGKSLLVRKMSGAGHVAPVHESGAGRAGGDVGVVVGLKAEQIHPGEMPDQGWRNVAQIGGVPHSSPAAGQAKADGALRVVLKPNGSDV